MPFKAIARPIGSPDHTFPVYILTSNNPKWEFRGCEFFCPYCESPMYIRGSLAVATHFAHKPTGKNCLYLTNPESDEHIAGKLALYQWLPTQHDYVDASIEIEKYIEDANRIADLHVSHKGGGTEVHEIQLSPIGLDELEERTRDYKEAGIERVYWWFGENVRGEHIIKWQESVFGHRAYIDFADSLYPQRI